MAKPPLHTSQVALMVNISGVPRRLVAAKERGPKGIVFFPQTPRNLEWAGKNLRVKAHHVSAWPNNSTGTVLLHSTYDLNDPEIKKIDLALLSINPNDFAAALFSVTIPWGEQEESHEIDLTKYSRAEITAYDASECTLVVCYCVATPGHPLPDMLSLGIASFTANFSRMRLAIYYTYLNLPSSPRGRVITLSTSTMRINDGETIHCDGPTTNPTVDLPKIIRMQMLHVIESYVATLKSDLAGISPSELNSIDSWVNSPQPISTLLAARVRDFSSLRGDYDLSFEDNLDI